MNIFDIVKNVKNIKRLNVLYYSMSDLYNKLLSYNAPVVFDDMIITPFYIDNNRIYELYDFNYNYIKSTNPCIEKRILKKTGKDSLDRINKNILLKLYKCYCEGNETTVNNDWNFIIQYAKYVLNNEELIERMNHIFGSFNKENIYYEVY